MVIMCALYEPLFSLDRSPAIVIAYLMKCKGWRFLQSYQWVKDRRPMVELSPGSCFSLYDHIRMELLEVQNLA